MNKVKLALALFSSVFLVTSCGSSGASEGVYTLELGESVLTKEMVAKNVNKNTYYTNRDYTYSSTKVSLGSNVHIDYADYESGYLITYDDTSGKYGIYSLLAGKVLVPCKITSSVTRDSDNYFGLRAFFKYSDNKYYYIDGAGNILNVDTKTFNVNSMNYSIVTDKTTNAKTLYSTLVTSKSGTSGAVSTTKYFQYDDKGKATVVQEIPKGDDAGYDRGDKYQDTTGRYDLTPFGISRYVVKENGIYYIYNTDGTLVSELNLPNSSSYSSLTSVSFCVGSKLFYQYSITLPYDAKDYTYAYSVNKAQVYTNIIDLATLEQKDIDCKVLFSSASLVKDAEGKTSYALVSCNEIRPDKLLGATRTLLMDQEGVFHDDMKTKPTLSSLALLSNGNYYDANTYTLYDADLKKIGSASDLNNYNIDFTREIIYGTKYVNGTQYYAYISNEGKHLVPSIYDRDTYYSSSLGLFNTVEFTKSYSSKVYYDLKEGKEIELDENESFNNSTGLINKLKDGTYTVRQFNSTKNLLTINNFDYMDSSDSFTRSFYSGFFYSFSATSYNSATSSYDYQTYCLRTAKFEATAMS